jgi:hypothetical protein
MTLFSHHPASGVRAYFGGSSGGITQATTYVMLFTTARAHYSAAQILKIYRLRWQTELVFKRSSNWPQLGICQRPR